MESPDEYAHRIYEQTKASLEIRAGEADFSLAVIKAEYEALCVYQGHGMDGRNFYKDAEIEGQIDAYQVFLHRLRNDNSDDTDN